MGAWLGSVPSVEALVRSSPPGWVGKSGAAHQPIGLLALIAEDPWQGSAVIGQGINRRAGFG